ncbi:MAG: hypothetical protein JRI80_00055 [Deltaproteobacteria bacterium]|nr:hypothetical protein [Deltaproteobacteria bacterium]
MEKTTFASIIIKSVLARISIDDPKRAIAIRKMLSTDTAILAFVLFCINTAAGAARSTVMTPSLN